MNYLFKYLCALTPEERTALAAMQVTEREQQVLDTMLQAVAHKTLQKDDVVQQLGITPVHFDKLCSTLLDKTYAAVVPTGGTDLLYHLNRRTLMSHFHHQMKKQEKQLLASSTPAGELAAFYFRCFTLLHRTSYKYYDDALARKVGDKYLAAKPLATEGDAAFVEACLLTAHIYKTAALGRGKRLAESIEQRIVALGNRIAQLDEASNVQAHHQINKTHITFYTVIDSTPEKRLRYLERAANLCERYPSELSAEEKVLTLCRIAEAHYASCQFEKAASLYHELFSAYTAITQRDFYHTTKYVQVLIVLGNYATAEQLLQQCFGVLMDNKEPTTTTMASLSYAKLYLRSGQLRKAKEFIDLGFECIAKNFYIQYEIELRILETVYFSLAGNSEFADELSTKHIKYLQSKGYTLRTSRYYPWFFTLLLAFSTEKSGAKKLTKKLEAKLKEFYDDGPPTLYGIFLTTIRAL